MKTFRLTVSMPDGNVYDGDVKEVITRGTEGCFSILAGHIPFVTAVVKGDFNVILEDDSEKKAVTDGGILTVTNEKVTFLTNAFKFND